MRVLTEKRKIVILLVAVFQLLNFSCTKQVYRDQSIPGTENRSRNTKPENSNTSHLGKGIDLNKSYPVKEKLQDFMASGTEKPLKTGNTTADEIIETASTYLGVPHHMGGLSRNGIDCSGLLVAVFSKYGIHLPHNSEDQARFGKKIEDPDQLIKGDLLFFVRSYKTTKYITHSAIYIGDNKFIHASVNYGVSITSLDDHYWKEKFVFGTRILK
jgi:cell wall-associated NlpC family hydrolase